MDRGPGVVVTDRDEDIIDRDGETGAGPASAAEWLPLHPLEGKRAVLLEDFAQGACARQDTPGYPASHVGVDMYRHAAPASVPPTVALTRARDK
jgi:hypothetical protein